MKYSIIYFLLFIQICLTTYSQVTDIVWQSCYGTDEDDTPASLIRLGNSKIYAIGVRKEEAWISNYHGGSDVWLVYTDSTNNIIWEKCYGGSSSDLPQKVIKINDDTFYVFSSSTSKDGDVQNGRDGTFWVMKVKNNGDIIWENSFGNGAATPRDAIITKDQGLILMGRILYPGGDVSTWYGENDIWVCNIDSIGNILWEKTLGNHEQDNGIKVKKTSQNTYLVIGGYQESGGMIECDHMGTTEWSDLIIYELDLNGDLLRQLCYGGSLNDLGFDIVEVSDGFIILGSTTSNDGNVSGNNGNYDLWIVKINQDGEIIWQNCIGGSQYEWARTLFKTNDEGVIVIGETNSHDGDIGYNHSSGNASDIWISYLDSTGDLMWEHCIGGEGEETFGGALHSIWKESDYNLYLMAKSRKISGDVECDLNPVQYGDSYDAWAINIKDCDYYIPSIPTTPMGPDTLCTTTDSISSYSITSAQGAWSYEWQVLPEEAGSIASDSITATLHWSPNWEGQTQISVRSWNDCGQSDWSDVKSSWAFSCLGIHSPSAGTHGPYLQIFPNPASTQIQCNIQNMDRAPEGSIETYNYLGVIMDVTHLQGKQKSINIEISSYPSGIYFAVLKSGSEVIDRKRFVKK